MAVAYLPLLILVIVATGFALLAMGAPQLLGPSRANKQKLEPYESGIIPFSDARRRFPIKYYLVAMLFILFDIEVVFFYPWAAVMRQLRDGYVRAGYAFSTSVLYTIVPVGFFLFILIVGLIYEWKKGALEWEQ
ncbi:MAG: NADH-quinone oxidoreductase subunit A [Chloroflexota bacterium]|nr:NADH-quinone oxidoreductase subunit A [Chloroflexota bacterium]